MAAELTSLSVVQCLKHLQHVNELGGGGGGGGMLQNPTLISKTISHFHLWTNVSTGNLVNSSMNKLKIFTTFCRIIMAILISSIADLSNFLDQKRHAHYKCARFVVYWTHNWSIQSTYNNMRANLCWCTAMYTYFMHETANFCGAGTSMCDFHTQCIHNAFLGTWQVLHCKSCSDFHFVQLVQFSLSTCTCY